MNIKLVFTFILMIAINFFIFADPKQSSSWSEYQGFISWDAAKSKCANLGMRLPKRDELESAFKAGVTESWKKDGVFYWLSDIRSEFVAYDFLISTGEVSNDLKYKLRRTRCIK